MYPGTKPKQFAIPTRVKTRAVSIAGIDTIRFATQPGHYFVKRRTAALCASSNQQIQAKMCRLFQIQFRRSLILSAVGVGRLTITRGTMLS
jgi:hypothetical protein